MAGRKVKQSKDKGATPRPPRPQTPPKFRRGEDVVFTITARLTGIVREVKTDEDGRVRYLIHGSFAFDVPEGLVNCRTAEAERVLGKEEAGKVKRSSQDWWLS